MDVGLGLLIERVHELGFEPRVHPNGFVQLDLNTEGTIRLHVWDDDVPCRATDTPIHDHVFHIKSEVILGTLIHEVFGLLYDDKGTHKIYHCQQEPGTQNTTLVPDEGGVSVTPVATQRLVLGETSIYLFEAGLLHQTHARGLTATVMEKRNAPADYGRPRVLVPVGQKPDNAFRRDNHDLALLWRIIDRALTSTQ